jgi:tetratricopeptide (TPR) repeat protein
MNKKIFTKIKYLGVLAILFAGASCGEEFLTVYPGEQLTTETAITDLAGAQSALYGVYDGMQSSGVYGCNMFTFGDLRGGDMQPTARTDSRTSPVYTFNNRTPDNVPAGYWSNPYVLLNRINSLIEAFDNGQVADGSEAERNRVLGQAYALRGLFHFDLVKLFGVPYAKDPGAPGAIIADHVILPSEINQRATVAQTYDQAIGDLTQAVALLENAKAKTNGYINYWAAKALLARVYLYRGEWALSFAAADDIIRNGGYVLVPNDQYIDAWGEEFTTESIFSIVNTTTDNPGREAISSVSAPSGYGEIILSTVMIDLLRAEAGDVRAQLIGTDKTNRDGYCRKYPGRGDDIFTNNIPIIRLSEVYLIAAEAALKKSPADQDAANTYLNAIRLRANPALQPVGATSELVYTERRKELVHEGHRFFDIMRLGLSVNRTGGRNFLNIDEVITVGWDNYFCVLPIPRAEINVNPGILPTPGYSNN